MGIREYRKSILRSFLHLVLWIVALLCHTRAEETDERVENHFTPVPLLDINKGNRIERQGIKGEKSNCQTTCNPVFLTEKFTLILRSSSIIFRFKI